jgi:hypothetical protein
MKKKPVQPQSEYQKLMYFIDQMDAFLAPRIMDALKIQIGKAMTERDQEDKEKLVSPKLLALQPHFESFEQSMRIYGDYTPRRFLWHLRPLFKKVIEIYGNKNNPK